MANWRLGATTAALAAAVAAWAIPACSTGGGERAVRACDVLDRRVSWSTSQGEESGALADVLEVMLGASGGTVAMYLEPGMADERLLEIRDEIDALAGTTIVAVADEAEAYEEFLDLFADEEDMIATVRPEDLPARIVVHIGPDAPVDLVDRLERWPGAYDVRTGPFEDRAPVAVGTAEAREGWTAAIAQLRRVEDQPRWATTGADLMEGVLAHGADWEQEVGGVDQELATAGADLDAATDAC